jgi:hypothetical protein
MRLRTSVVISVAGAVVAGSVVVGAGQASAATPSDDSWSADLSSASAAGVAVVDGVARLAGKGAFSAPAGDAEGGPDPLAPTGLLTFPAHQLDRPTDRIATKVDGTGTGTAVDVRGLRSNGSWTEWVPAAADGSVTLPGLASQAQGRLVLTDPAAAVSGVELTAKPGDARSEGVPDAPPVSYSVFATREGLVGGTTANGHEITDHDHFVALPSRRALSADGSSDYSVKVCAPNGRCAFAPVWDIGPWNTHDDYWNPPNQREQWGDLPQGTPQAQAAFKDGYNDGKDGFDRKVLNGAGIDLGDGVFWDDLGLTDNSQVTVSYLWTGNDKLATVAGDTAKVLAAPDAKAEVVGMAAQNAQVPVQCSLTSALGSYVQIGVDQFLDAAAVPDLTGITPCPAPSGTPAGGLPGGQLGAGAAPSGLSQAGPNPLGPALRGALTPGRSAVQPIGAASSGPASPDAASPDTASPETVSSGATSAASPSGTPPASPNSPDPASSRAAASSTPSSSTPSPSATPSSTPSARATPSGPLPGTPQRPATSASPSPGVAGQEPGAASTVAP